MHHILLQLAFHLHLTSKYATQSVWPRTSVDRSIGGAVKGLFDVYLKCTPDDGKRSQSEGREEGRSASLKE